MIEGHEHDHRPARIHVGITPAGARAFIDRISTDADFLANLADPAQTSRLFAEYGIEVPFALVEEGVKLPTKEELNAVLPTLNEQFGDDDEEFFFFHPLMFCIFAVAGNFRPIDP